MQVYRPRAVNIFTSTSAFKICTSAQSSQNFQKYAGIINIKKVLMGTQHFHKCTREVNIFASVQGPGTSSKVIASKFICGLYDVINMLNSTFVASVHGSQHFRKHIGTFNIFTSAQGSQHFQKCTEAINI